MKREEVIRLFPERIRKILQQADWNPQGLQEIRLRAGKPLILWQDGQEYFVAEQGFLTRHREQAYIVSQEEIRRTMETVGTYSLYAYEEELKQGFLTIQGGHRVGVAGKAIMEEQKVKGLSQISCINIRFAHQITGCADMVIPYVTEEGKLCHTLIISPPGCGKTTLLRDLVRQISDGWETFPGYTVGVVDERSEIGGSYQGIPQNDVGIRTDVLDACPKAKGLMMLIRSMAPEVVAADEIGSQEDLEAFTYAMRCGCVLFATVHGSSFRKLLATVHGSSIDEIRKKPLLERLMKEHVFERYIILQKETAGQIGKVQEIYDERGTCLYQRQRSVC